MRDTKAFRNQQFDRLRDEFSPRVAEDAFRLRIRESDRAFVVDQENRAGSCLDNRTEALLAGAELRRKLPCRDHVPAEFIGHRQDDDEDTRHDDRGGMNDP